MGASGLGEIIGVIFRDVVLTLLNGLEKRDESKYFCWGVDVHAIGTRITLAAIIHRLESRISAAR